MRSPFPRPVPVRFDRQQATPFQGRLSGCSTGQSVAFGVFEHGKPKPVGAAFRDDPIQIGVAASDPIPFYCTTIGRLWLASRSDVEALEIVEGEQRLPRTDRTLTAAPAIMARIEETRRLGYSLVDQETLPMLRSLAVGVRNGLGETVAWLSITAHTSMLTLKDLRARIAPEMKRSAADLSRQLP